MRMINFVKIASTIKLMIDLHQNLNLLLRFPKNNPKDQKTPLHGAGKSQSHLTSQAIHIEKDQFSINT